MYPASISDSSNLTSVLTVRLLWTLHTRRSFKELLAAKHPTAWVEFECGEITGGWVAPLNVASQLGACTAVF